MFVPKGYVNNMPVLIQIMAWYRTGDKQLSEPRWHRLYASPGLNELKLYPHLSLSTACAILLGRERKISQIAKFMGRTWGPPGSCRRQMGPMLAPWNMLSGSILLSGYVRISSQSSFLGVHINRSIPYVTASDVSVIVMRTYRQVSSAPKQAIKLLITQM